MQGSQMQHTWGFFKLSTARKAVAVLQLVGMIAFSFSPLFSSAVFASSTSTSSCSATVSVNAGDSVDWTVDLTGSGGSVSFAWSGSDGLSGTAQNVSHTYASAGNVSAIAAITVTSDGSATTACNNVSYTITPAPVVNTAPIIALNGASSITLTVGDVFTDPGATANDAEDGDLTAGIVTIGSVDTSAAGTYTRTYTVTDSGGLSATVTRSVIVNAASVNTAPTVTITGANPMTVAVGSVFADPGATANDTEDGDLTSSIATTGSVDISTAGSYTLTYTVTDSGGLTDSKSRIVVVSSSSSPTSTCTKTMNVTSGDTVVWSTPALAVSESPTYSWTGTDGLTGSTNSVTHTYSTTQSITASVTVTANTSASCTITYTVTPASGNTAPSITLLGSNPMIVAAGSVFTDPGATANDAEDGDLTASIVTTGSVDTSAAGTYTRTYTVTDSGGLSATATRTVKVISGGGSCTLPATTDNLNLTAPAESPMSFTINISNADSITISTSSVPSGVFVATTTTTITFNGSTNQIGTFNVPFTATNSCGTLSNTIAVNITGNSSGGGGGGSIPTLTVFNEKASRTDATTIQVTWDTNLSATSKVFFDIAPRTINESAINYGYASTTVEDMSLTPNHSVLIENAPADQTVYVRPISVYENSPAHGIELIVNPLGITVPTSIATSTPLATSTPAAVVIGVCTYLEDYLKIGQGNNPVEVLKLQTFLNNFENAGLIANGIFDQATDSAVRAYQAKYTDEILKPWDLHGAPTGYVYILTKKHINETVCQREFPLTPAEQQEIDNYRVLLAQIQAAANTTTNTQTTSTGVNIGTSTPNTETTTPNIGTSTPELPIIGLLEPTTMPPSEKIGITNRLYGLAAAIFALPESSNQIMALIVALIVLLPLIYITGSIIIMSFYKGQSKGQNIDHRQLRRPKLISFAILFAVGAVVSLLFNAPYITWPLGSLAVLSVLFSIFVKFEQFIEHTETPVFTPKDLDQE